MVYLTNSGIVPRVCLFGSEFCPFEFGGTVLATCLDDDPGLGLWYCLNG